MKEEKLAKLLKKELGYWFEVETCDDTQNDVKLRQTDSVHFKFVIMNTDRCGSNMAKKS